MARGIIKFERIPTNIRVPIVIDHPPRIRHNRIRTDKLPQLRVVVAGVVVVEASLVFLLACVLAVELRLFDYKRTKQNPHPMKILSDANSAQNIKFSYPGSQFQHIAGLDEILRPLSLAIAALFLALYHLILSPKDEYQKQMLVIEVKKSHLIKRTNIQVDTDSLVCLLHCHVVPLMQSLLLLEAGMYLERNIR